MTLRPLWQSAAPASLMYNGRTHVFADRPKRSSALKRTLDLLIAVPLSVVVLPLLAPIALAVMLSSPGPVMFAQLRASSRIRRTRMGDELVAEVYAFRCYKIRTMRAHADEGIHVEHVRSFIRGEARPNGADGFKVRSDDRITPIGWLLRRSSMDELPQLFNVVRGDMSLVGPRPVPLYEIAEYPCAALERLLVKPGLTGLWQVEARSSASFEEMIALDVQYARSNSLLIDLRLLARTFPCVIARRGAA